MKKNYSPKKLTKKQRHMKKWIPDYGYCEGIYGNECPFYKVIWYDASVHDPEELDEKLNDETGLYNKKALKEIKAMIGKNYNHKREECQFGDWCKENCSKCKEKVSYCAFLNYIEYGQYPLGDMCKICGIHRIDRKEYRRDIHGNWFKAKGWKGKRKRMETFNKQLKVRMWLYPELFEGSTYDDLKETHPW